MRGLPASLRGQPPPADASLGLAKVLVTGASGIIGSHVARLAVERGDDVRLAVKERSPDGAIADLDSERLGLLRRVSRLA